MPELPDIELYLHALRPRIVGQMLRELTVLNPFVLRSIDPPVDALRNIIVRDLSRMGKRVVIRFEHDLYVVIHLMIAGRFRWLDGKRPPAKLSLATFDFPNGTLVLTEAGTTRRASIHLLRGADGLAQFDRGGLEIEGSTREQFAERLKRENHTLKRSLTDPRAFSGIGNAYSDELLHKAQLSPLKLTKALTDDEIDRLYDATKVVLADWKKRLIDEVGDGFPEKVTAFKEGMAVHGRFKEPCPVCGTPIQRIRYATNETNYCARCQTGGRLLADRAMSRLLKQDWPRSIDEAD